MPTFGLPFSARNPIKTLFPMLFFPYFTSFGRLGKDHGG
jgi:hypothetical protein